MATRVNESSRTIVIFNNEESLSYFSVERPCKIISKDGTNLTDEKIALVMQKAVAFFTSYRGSPKSNDVIDGFNQFRKFCEEQNVEFSLVNN